MIAAPSTREFAQPARTRSRFRGLWHRFAQNRLAVCGLAIVFVLVFVAVAAPILEPGGYNDQIYEQAYLFPSWSHPLGTDSLGREMLARIIYGARTSLLVGLVSQVLACAIGVPLGALAGYFGARVDYGIMRIVDAMTAFPSLLFAILVMSVLGPGLVSVLIAISLTSWIGSCRMTRANILQLREAEYVVAARSIGASTGQIIRSHLLPNALTPLIVGVTLGIPDAIFAEAGLSFLGLGINPPRPSWGQMIGESTQYLSYYWYLAIFPALALALMMLGFTWTGDGIRDAVDPHATR
jgi:ABC-type dipeptide/oligopeptide/nickel transport system permease subunit